MARFPRPALLPLLLAVLGPLVPAVAADTPSLFVDTEPMGARIRIDGLLTADRTPALVRGLSPGRHRIDLWHEGFAEATRTVDTGAQGPVPVVEVDLTPESLVLAFPGVSAVDDGQGGLPAAGRQFRYPDGTYRTGSSDGTARLIPVFGDEGLLTAAGWSLAVTAVAALASAGSDAVLISGHWADHPAFLTGALGAAAVLELPWFLSLSSRKARFLRDEAPATAPLPQTQDPVKALWDQGEEALQSGDLAAAEPFFAQVVRTSPGSRLVPGAWFRLARIHALTGRRDLAAGEYRLVAETYPQAAYHDRARKTLADLEEAAGDPARALEDLAALTPDDGLYDSADLDAQRARLTAALEPAHAP
jgi:hypothetical protein